MKKLFALFSILTMSGLSWGAGGFTGLTVSSGTYQPISTYSNDDGGNRQAILIGNRTSSATVNVDAAWGMSVYVTNPTTATVSGTVSAIQSGVYQVEPGTNNFRTSVINTPAVSQSGTWTVQPGNTANTTAWKVDGSAVTQPISGAVSQTGVFQVEPGTNTFKAAIQNTVAVTGSGAFSVNPGTGTFPVAGPVSQSGVFQVEPGTNNFRTSIINTPTVNAAQSGTWQAVRVDVGTGTWPVAGAVSKSGAWGVDVGTGTWPVSIVAGAGSGGTSSNFTAAFPTAGTAIGGINSNGNMQAFRVDSSSNIYVNIAAGAGSGGTASNFGVTYPTAGTAAGFFGTNGGLMGAAVDSSSYQVVSQGNPGTVGWRVDYSTGVQANIAVQASGGTKTNVGYQTGGSSVPVSVLNTVTVSGTVAATQSGVFQVETGTNTFPVAIRNTPSVAQSGTWTVQPGNTPNSTPWLVDPSHASDATMNASVSIKGSSNTVTANHTLLVSSNTAVPTGVADAGNARAMGDTYGRLITLPIAPRALVQVATATLTTTTSEIVLISSTSAKFVRLIGCIGENTSSTAADVTIRLNGGPTANNVGSFKLGMSVSNVPVGFFPPGGIVAQLANANTTIQGSASVTSLHLTCWYMLE